MQVLEDVILHVYELQAPEGAEGGSPSQSQQQQQQSSTNNNNNAGIRTLSWFSKTILPSIGMGAYHTCIEIMNDRYTFAANAGIIKTRCPSSSTNNRRNFSGGGGRIQDEPVPTGATYKESIVLGASSISNRGELNEIIKRLQTIFTKTAYHLVHRNCNHFTETFATAIILHDELIEQQQQGSSSSSSNSNSSGSGSINIKLSTYPIWINRLANTSKLMISHDSDIISCNVIEEAKMAIGANNKVGWGIGNSNNNNNNKKTTTGSGSSNSGFFGFGNSKQNSSSTKNNKKKELTEKQKAALAKIRGSK